MIFRVGRSKAILAVGGEGEGGGSREGERGGGGGGGGLEGHVLRKEWIK